MAHKILGRAPRVIGDLLMERLLQWAFGVVRGIYSSAISLSNALSRPRPGILEAAREQACARLPDLGILIRQAKESWMWLIVTRLTVSGAEPFSMRVFTTRLGWPRRGDIEVDSKASGE
jgi:hypothetical protein